MMTSMTDEGVVTGRLNLTAEDLQLPLAEMSWLTRLRWAFFALTALTVLFELLLVRSATRALVGIPYGLYTAWLFWRPWYTARRTVAAIVRPGDSEWLYRFDSEGVTIRSPGSTLSVAMRALVRVKEGKTAFLLYITPSVAQIVHKRAFAPADVDRVRALLAPHTRIVPVGSLSWRVRVCVALFLIGALVAENSNVTWSAGAQKVASPSPTSPTHER
jgi:hypothetical protein